MKYIDKQRFLRIFLIAIVLQACVYLSACTSAWLTSVSAMLPAISAVVSAIAAFVGSLQGKTISANFYAAVQKWQQNISTEIANVQNIIAQLKAQTTPTLISDLQTAMSAISSEFQSILNAADVTDTATVAKLTQFLGLGIAAINAVLALIPSVLSALNKPQPSQKELAQYDKLGAHATTAALKTMQETYAVILTEHTDNADVNAALDALPRSI
jgi:hypothetical protein